MLTKRRARRAGLTVLALSLSLAGTSLTPDRSQVRATTATPTISSSAVDAPAKPSTPTTTPTAAQPAAPNPTPAPSNRPDKSLPPRPTPAPSPSSPPEPADPFDPALEPPEEPAITPGPYEAATPPPPPASQKAPDGVPLDSQPIKTTRRPADMADAGDSTQIAPQGTTDCPVSGPHISSDDGLDLGLSSTGAIVGIKNGSHCLERLAKSGGFSMRMIGQSAGNPNLLKNSGFDTVTGSGSSRMPVSWYRTGTGPVVTQPGGTHKDGAYSIEVSRGTQGTSGDFHQTLTVDPLTSYILAGWFRAGRVGQPSSYVLPTATSVTNPIVSKKVSPLVLSATVKDSSGHVLRTAVAYGYTNQADWQIQSAGFRTPSNARTVVISVRMIDGKGVGWFDALSLKKLFAANGSSLIDSTVTQEDANTLSQHAEFDGQPLVLDATYTARPKAIRIDATISLKSGHTGEEAFQVAFVLPVKAVGWFWADYARASRTMAASTRYDYENYQTTPTSRYPWATIYSHDDALSIGSPLSVPRGYTMRYDSREGLVIKFDLALSSAATKLDGATTFSIQLFNSDPAWGFRASTDKYYDISPGDFARFPDPDHKLDGALFFHPDLNALDPNGLSDGDQSKDFGLGVNIVNLGYNGEWGKPYVNWDDDRGYPTIAYIHMWGDFRNKCADGGTSCPILTYEQMVAALEDDAAHASNPRVRDESYSSLRSAVRDINGRIRYDGRYSDYRIFEGPDPDIAGTVNWVDIINTYMRDAAVDNAASPPSGTLDGIYSDSTSGFRQWGAVSDYDKTHWAVADMPLMFDYDSGRVAQRGHFNNYEQLKRLRNWANDRGMFVSFNFNADEVTEGGYLGADMSDHFLIEKGLPDRTFPEFGTTVDSFAMLKRTLAKQRPVSSSDQNGCKAGYPLSSIRARVQQSLFYGIYYGPCRWEQTSWWDSGHRAIFKQFSPYFERLGNAGWQVITNARSTNTNVRVERFGSLNAGTLNLTLRNETSSTQTATIKVWLDNDYDSPPSAIGHIEAKLDWQAVGGTSMSHLVYSDDAGSDPDRTLTLNGAKTKATLSVTLPAYTTGVLKVTQP